MRKYLLERELAHHCAPALCGMKPANLVCFAKREFPELYALLPEYQKEFSRFGVCLEVVCSCDRRDLVLVYQQSCWRGNSPASGYMSCYGRMAIRAAVCGSRSSI